MIRVNFRLGVQTGGGALVLPPVVLRYWADVPPLPPSAGLPARVVVDFVFRAGQESAALDAVDFHFGDDSAAGAEQGVFAAGFVAGGVGVLGVRNFWTFAGAAGWDSQGFGRARLFNLNQWVRAYGWAAGSAGYPSVRSTKRSVFVREMRGRGGVGFPRVDNFLKFVFTGNLYPPDLPKGAMVDFAVRHLRPDGIAALRSGNAAVTGFVRGLEARGIAPPKPSVHWVSRSPRVLDADGVGIAPPEIRRPRVGNTQVVQPQGFEATLWLERIVPAPQGIYTQAWSAEEVRNGWAVFGAVRVRNGRDFVYAVGQQSHGAEDLRFGWAKIELMRRYVVQIHDEFGGLTVQPWSLWQSVANRNREIRHYSDNPAALPAPLVYNAARVVAPVGIDGAVPQVLQLTHGVRRVFPESFEPPLVSHWSAVYLGARVLGVFGMGAGRDAVPPPSVANTRRYYRWIGGMDSAVWGVPFVDFARREIVPYPTRDLQPQTVPLPDVALGRRFVSTKGVDAGGFGVASLGIRFNRIEPRFARQAVFGWAEVRNVTPELRAHGGDMADFGAARVWLQRRFVVQTADGAGFDGFGRAWVADTRRTVAVAGFVAGGFGARAKVWHLTTPDNYSRVVYPAPAAWGYGGDFGRPRINTTILYPRGIAPPKLGEPSVVSFAIWVELGIGSDWAGVPSVTHFHRSLAPKGWAQVQMGKPDLSPRTIWCRSDVPHQALANHSGMGWQPVDAMARYHKRIGFGVHSVRLAGAAAVRARGADTALFGTADVSLRRRFLLPKGRFVGRMGWATVGDGRQWVELFDSDDFAVFGTARVGFVPLPDNTVAGRGWVSSQTGTGHGVSLWVRTLAPQGFAAGGMGFSRPDTRYMPQSLHVGFPMPVRVAGADTAQMGTADVSHFHRSVAVAGFDGFASGYEPQSFGARMRVWGTRPANLAPPVPVARRLGVAGFDAGSAGVPQDVSWRVRYIRPDGFMDNYRKGVSSV